MQQTQLGLFLLLAAVAFAAGEHAAVFDESTHNAPVVVPRRMLNWGGMQPWLLPQVGWVLPQFHACQKCMLLWSLSLARTA